MYSDAEEITAQVTARICHDLVSPLGAIQNGLELMELSGHTPSEEFDLVRQSTQNANSTLSFLRVAFRTSEDSREMPRGDIERLLFGHFHARRLDVVWDIDGPQRRTDVTTCFLMAMCFESAMPTGGRLVFRKAEPSWAIEATSNRFEFDEALWASIGEDASARTTASAIHFELARQSLKSCHARQEWSELSGGRRFIFTPNGA